MHHNDFTKIMIVKIWVQIGKNKFFILQLQNIGNRNNALVTIGKSLEEGNI